MKNTLIILFILCFPLFYSCKNKGGDIFLGSWKNKQRDSIEVTINRDGRDFAVITAISGRTGGAIKFILKDGLLTRPQPKYTGPSKYRGLVMTPDISYVASSGELSWAGTEWERISN